MTGTCATILAATAHAVRNYVRGYRELKHFSCEKGGKKRHGSRRYPPAFNMCPCFVTAAGEIFSATPEMSRARAEQILFWQTVSKIAFIRFSNHVSI